MDKITPIQGSTQNVAVTSTPSVISVDASRATIRVLNKGPNFAFVRWWQSSEGAQTATLNDLPISPAYEPQVIDIGLADQVGAVCAPTETATIYVTMLLDD